MKRFIALFTLIVFLASGCGYSKEYVEDVRHNAFDSGYSAGEQAGYTSGYEDGYEAGYEDAEKDIAGKSNSSRVVHPSPKPSQSKSVSVTVYITRTGEKYHKSWCQYLSESKISISLEKAKKQGYTACSKCS